jgi:hypothetical protein
MYRDKTRRKQMHSQVLATGTDGIAYVTSAPSPGPTEIEIQRGAVGVI